LASPPQGDAEGPQPSSPTQHRIQQGPIRSSQPRLPRSWHTDITYIPTWQGWLYLATVIDCFNKEVIGYAMADHMRAELVCEALDMAARNHRLSPGCIFHSDRGSQYTSAEFAAALAHHTMRQSLGRTGVCYDNALAESFNAALKVERVHRTAYPTRKHAMAHLLQPRHVVVDEQELQGLPQPLVPADAEQILEGPGH
jgi:transposase InsO family protein